MDFSGVSVDAGGYITATHIGESGTPVTTLMTYNGLKLTWQADSTPGSLVATATDGTPVFRVTGDPQNSQVHVTMLATPDMTIYTATTFSDLKGGNTRGSYFFSDTHGIFAIEVIGARNGTASTVNTNNGYFGILNNFIDANEALTLRFATDIRSVSLALDNLASGESMRYEAYDRQGGLVTSGSVPGSGTGGGSSFNVDLGAASFANTDIATLVLRSGTSSNFRVGLTAVTGETSMVQQTITLAASAIDADGDPTSAARNFQVVFNAGAPLAVDDTASTPEDTSVSGNVLTNDSDPEGSALTVTNFTLSGSSGPVASGQTVTVAGVGTLQVTRTAVTLVHAGGRLQRHGADHLCGHRWHQHSHGSADADGDAGQRCAASDRRCGHRVRGGPGRRTCRCVRQPD